MTSQHVFPSMSRCYEIVTHLCPIQTGDPYTLSILFHFFLLICTTRKGLLTQYAIIQIKFFKVGEITYTNFQKVSASFPQALLYKAAYKWDFKEKNIDSVYSGKNQSTIYRKVMEQDILSQYMYISITLHVTTWYKIVSIATVVRTSTLTKSDFETRKCKKNFSLKKDHNGQNIATKNIVIIIIPEFTAV